MIKSRDEFINKGIDAGMLNPEHGSWIICDDVQARWLLSNGIKSMKPISSITINLKRGRSQFLLDILKILDPKLPFKMIRDADVEHLLSEMLDRARYEPASANFGKLCITFSNKSDLEKMVRILAALRFATYCLMENNWRIIVIDQFTIINSFDLYQEYWIKHQEYRPERTNLKLVFRDSFASEIEDYVYDIFDIIEPKRRWIENRAYYLSKENPSRSSLENWRIAEESYLAYQNSVFERERWIENRAYYLSKENPSRSSRENWRTAANEYDIKH